jgi:hypothetical protein
MAQVGGTGGPDAGIAAGAALGGLVLRLADVRDTFLTGGLLTAGGCAVLLGAQVPRHGPRAAGQGLAEETDQPDQPALARTGTTHHDDR